MTSPSKRKRRRVLVLDTSAFIAGFDPFSVNEKVYTVPMVREELARNALLSFKIKTALETRRMETNTPNDDSLAKVKTFAEAAGDAFYLSETDRQILALALELKKRGLEPLIATDDYSIQNVADRIGIDFAPLATFGIRLRLEWIRYCPACHKGYPADCKLRNCQVCGTELKRKPLRDSRKARETTQRNMKQHPQ